MLTCMQIELSDSSLQSVMKTTNIQYYSFKIAALKKLKHPVRFFLKKIDVSFISFC